MILHQKCRHISHLVVIRSLMTEPIFFWWNSDLFKKKKNICLARKLTKLEQFLEISQNFMRKWSRREPRPWFPSCGELIVMLNFVQQSYTVLSLSTSGYETRTYNWGKLMKQVRLSRATLEFQVKVGSKYGKTWCAKVRLEKSYNSNWYWLE